MGTQDLLQDLRYAVRSMFRHAGFTAIHIVLIAASIGLTSSAFIVMDAVLLRSLPAISDPDQLVMIGGARDNNDRVDGQPWRIFEHLRHLRDGTSHIFAYRNYGALPATIGTATTPMRGMGVAGDYFEGLGGVPLVMGRTFDPDSDEPVSLIGYWVWRERFGGATDVLGRTITLGTVALTVVGVAHEDFVGTQPDLRWDLLMPLRVLDRARGLSPEAALNQPVYTLARLNPGVSPEEYQARPPHGPLSFGQRCHRRRRSNDGRSAEDLALPSTPSGLVRPSH